jgi:hypothetical protein
LRRAADFTVQRITQRWATLLYQTVPELARLRATRHYAGGPRLLRRLSRKLIVRSGVEDLLRRRRRGRQAVR